MAYKIKELLPKNNLNSILSSAVCIIYGTVKLTHSSKIIILIRDAQITDGYPRILNLPESAINSLSQ